MFIKELICNVVLNQICTRQTHLHTYPQVYDPIVQTSVLVNTTLGAILSGGWGGEGREEGEIEEGEVRSCTRERGEGGREINFCIWLISTAQQVMNRLYTQHSVLR